MTDEHRAEAYEAGTDEDGFDWSWRCSDCPAGEALLARVEAEEAAQRHREGR